MRFGVGIAAASVITVVAGAIFVFPSPPQRIVVAAGIPGTALNFYAQRYKEHLSKFGYTLELRQSTLPPVSLLLGGPKEDVQIALVNGGIAEGATPDAVVSLGAVHTSALWIFCRARQILPHPVS